MYLGQGAYGVEAASRAYFDKSASEVNLAEAALLAALVRNPSNYDPITNPEVAKERRRVALARMQDEGLIDEEGVEFIDAYPLPTRVYDRTAAKDSQSLTYIERKIRDELLDAEWLAPTVEQRRYLIFNGGLRITSTIDPRAQALAEAAAAKNPLAEANPQTVVGLAAVEPSTGAVRAIVGEAVIDGTPIEVGDPVRGERSGDGGFSSGSAYKPVTLLAALEQGYTIDDTILGDPAPEEYKREVLRVDRPGAYPKDCPTRGPQPLANHLKASNNCAFMRLQSAVGFDAVRDMGVRLGLDRAPLDPANVRPACFTIGCDALVTPLDMATAYGTIANDGRKNPAHFVERVEDRDGKVLFESAPVNEQVIRGGDRPARRPRPWRASSPAAPAPAALPRGPGPAAGKTGTIEVGSAGQRRRVVRGLHPPAVHRGVDRRPTRPADGPARLHPRAAAAPGVIWQEFMAAYLEGAR